VDVDGDDDASASSPPVRRVPPPPPPPKPRAKLAPRPPKARDDSSDDAGGDVIDSDEEDGEVAPTAGVPAQKLPICAPPQRFFCADGTSARRRGVGPLCSFYRWQLLAGLEVPSPIVYFSQGLCGPPAKLVWPYFFVGLHLPHTGGRVVKKGPGRGSISPHVGRASKN